MKINFLFLVLLLWLPIKNFSQTHAPSTYFFRAAFDNKLFIDVNRNDAQSALRLWTKEISKNFTNNSHLADSNLTIQIEISLVDKIDSVLNKTSKIEYDIINLLSIDYIQYHNSGLWSPVVSSAGTGHYPEEYVLLVHRNTRIPDLNSLKNKKLRIPFNQDIPISTMWLENTVLSEYGVLPDAFFKTISKSGKSSAAVLDVFFKKADACLVGYNAFKTMAELNPQIEKKLKIIRTSPPFIKGITCIKKSFYDWAKPDVIYVLNNLQKTAAGRQVLALFGQSRVVPFKEKDILSIQKMVQEHKKRISKYKARELNK